MTKMADLEDDDGNDGDDDHRDCDDNDWPDTMTTTMGSEDPGRAPVEAEHQHRLGHCQHVLHGAEVAKELTLP